MTTQVYLKLPNKTIPVEIVPTNNGLLVLASKFSFELVGLDTQPVPAMARTHRPRVDVLAMTPADVARYFEQSPDLAIYAEDVRTAVLPANLAPSSDFQLNQDLRAVQHLNDPSLADISEVLTGDRVYGGATYKRVKLVQEALKTTSTTGKETSTPVENRKAA